MMEKKLLHTPEGVRDIYNSECEKKLILQEKLHKKLTLYGYRDIQTPTFEFFDIFSREIGTTPSKDLYKFFDREGNTLVLRPDFTPSIARCAAKYYMEEDAPLRLCYAGSAFINHSEYRGKLKETTQMGAELIGDNSVDADAELIVLMIDMLLESGLTDFQVELGQIEFFRGLAEEAGLTEEEETALRKLISIKNHFGVEEMLDRVMKENPAREALLNLPRMFGTVEILKEARQMTVNKRALKAVGRLEQLYEVLKLYGREQYVSFDLGMLSKYKYYTGIICQAYTFGTGEPIVKGGRYDNLLGWFGKDAPSVGFVVVVDVLMSALMRQKKEPERPKGRTVVVYRPDLLKEAVALAKELRGRQENTELISITEEKTLADWLSFGRRTNSRRILYMDGPKQVQLLDMETDDVKTVQMGELFK